MHAPLGQLHESGGDRVWCAASKSSVDHLKIMVIPIQYTPLTRSSHKYMRNEIIMFTIF